MAGHAQLHSLPELLHRVFGHREFRAHQQQVCEAAASGQDTLLVMPTGAGKSLCYQLPTLARGGTGLVISPLIALMDDQAGKLSSLGLRVARIHSGLDRETARQACRDYLSGALDFLFIAPERMRVAGFPEMLAKRKPALIAIDEAHCISQWGHDFRPDYRTLGQHLPPLRPAPIVALTATATPAVQRDIAKQLDLRDPAIFITGFARHNLSVEVLELSKPQRPEFTENLLADKSTRPAIVYAPSRKAAEELAIRLNKKYSAAAYHAGLDPATRERVQRGFLSGKLEVIVATIAFGMGVDKPDVRTVVHIALPGSVEAYYQEIGRAGRDGLPSRTVLLYSFADRKTQEFLLERNYPARSELERVARLLHEEFIEPDLLQQKLKIDRETLDRSLEKLIVQGVAVADWNGNVRSTGERGWQPGYDAQVAARRTQIDRMMAFAEGATCRMTALVEHFGDHSGADRACGKCDICRPVAEGGSMRQPDGREREHLRAILAAVEKRSTSTGKLFSELELTRDRKEFDSWIDGLARAALIAIANDTFRAPDGRDVTYRKVSITHEGRTPDDATLDTVLLRNVTAPAKPKRSARERRSKPSRFERANNPEAVRSSSRRRNQDTVTSNPDVSNSGIIWNPVTSNTSSSNTASSNRAIPNGALSNSVISTEAAAKPSRSGETRSSNPASPAARSAHKQTHPSALIELNTIQKQLDDRLRAWRKEQAQAAGLPSFFIFSDTVLRDIAIASPTSLADLRSVRGLGPDKLDRFGAAVLELCRA